LDSRLVLVPIAIFVLFSFSKCIRGSLLSFAYFCFILHLFLHRFFVSSPKVSQFGGAVGAVGARGHGDVRLRIGARGEEHNGNAPRIA
jgi:hypothetical protein